MRGFSIADSGSFADTVAQRSSAIAVATTRNTGALRWFRGNRFARPDGNRRQRIGARVGPLRWEGKGQDAPRPETRAWTAARGHPRTSGV